MSFKNPDKLKKKKNKEKKIYKSTRPVPASVSDKNNVKKG